MTVNQLKTALESTGIPVYPYRAPENLREKYIVFGATASDAPDWGDDAVQCFRIHGEVWYFSTDAFDPAVNDIMTALLADPDCSATIRQIGYDDELQQIIHIIDWSILTNASGIY